MRLLQFLDKKGLATVGMVEDDKIFIIDKAGTAFELFTSIINNDKKIEEVVFERVTQQYEDYERLIVENRILLPISHPDPYHTWITGTGLTHLGSAASRDEMHKKINQESEGNLSDSMKMFNMGLANGKMQGKNHASQPEWFFKGNGLMAVPPGGTLAAPSFALDGGEEPEVAGIYINDEKGIPQRIGFCLGNEFSDHKMEQINYLYLAHSKLRQCSYGPELLIGALPDHVVGESRIIRDEAIIWEKEFLTGESNMSHNIANLEHHHFKYDLFRQPGDLHVHFFGTSVLSFADNVETRNGDIFEIESKTFGKPLRNIFLSL